MTKLPNTLDYNPKHSETQHTKDALAVVESVLGDPVIFHMVLNNYRSHERPEAASLLKERKKLFDLKSLLDKKNGARPGSDDLVDVLLETRSIVNDLLYYRSRFLLDVPDAERLLRE